MNDLKGTPLQKELLRKMGSANKAESWEAQEAIAKFITAPVLQAIQEASLAPLVYKDLEFDADDNPTIPLDLYYNENYVGQYSIWTSTTADGLASNLVDVPTKELQVQMYDMKSAISFNKKHALKGRLNVLSDSMIKFKDEFVHLQNVNSFNPILAGLATGAVLRGKNVAFSTSGSKKNVLRSSGSTLQMKDFSDLIAHHKKLNISQFGGTPANYRGMAGYKMMVSYDVMSQIREFSFNPIRSDASASTSNSTSLPESEREKIFSSAGASSLFGIEIFELAELGLSNSFNTIFDTYAGSNSFLRADGANGSTFDTATDEILILVDSNSNAFRRCVSLNPENNSQLTILPDDQFTARSKKLGFWAEITESYVVLDQRKCVGLMLG